MDSYRDYHNRYFDSLQALRAIAALCILWEHIPFFGRGSFAVDIFFCLSGFTAMHSSRLEGQPFLGRRLRKLLPLYYAMTLLTFFAALALPGLFAQTRADLPSLAASLLFIPFSISPGIVQPLLRLGWTLNVEMAFYLCFVLANRYAHRWRGLIVGGLFGLLAFAGMAYPLSPGQSAGFSWEALSYFFTRHYMADFALGIGIYYLGARLYGHKRPVGSLTALLAALAMLAAYPWLMPYIPSQGLGRMLSLSLPGAGICLAFLWADACYRTPRFLRSLGSASYSLYLLHYYPILAVHRLLYPLDVLEGKSLSIALAMSLLLFLAALASKRFIEDGLIPWLFSLFRRRQKNS